MKFKNIFYPPSDHNHWHWQLHLNCFAAADYVRYFQYLNDTAFFREKGYPVLKGIAEFFGEFLNYDKALKAYVLPPTLSLAEDYFVGSPIESMLSAKWVLTMAARYAGMLSVDGALAKKWAAIAGKVYIPQNKEHYLEWQGDDFTRQGGRLRRDKRILLFWISHHRVYRYT